MVQPEPSLAFPDATPPRLMPNAIAEPSIAQALPTWARLFLIILSVGGGVPALTSALLILCSLAVNAPATGLICLAFVAMYAFVIVAGLSLVVDATRTRPMMLALLPQVAFCTSRSVSYQFISGPWLMLRFSESRIFFGIQAVSEWQFRLGQPVPFSFGLNLLAIIALAYLIVRHFRQSNCHAYSRP